MILPLSAVGWPWPSEEWGRSDLSKGVAYTYEMR